MSNKEKSNIPEKGTAQHKANEKLIMADPMLKKARDQSQGFTESSTIKTSVPSQAYMDNYDAIFGKKDKKEEE